MGRDAEIGECIAVVWRSKGKTLQGKESVGEEGYEVLVRGYGSRDGDWDWVSVRGVRPGVN